ncbi:MAG: class I SAM-dependent methyltransferase [Acidobacteriaceae bacterium]|nr:class I SAM-dependent methyltransferase [Acidobacteriaceae bacterium]MBV9760065.1 class I SAM-dependent methyltransferase [Acidobacteriaceae bacterium]
MHEYDLIADWYSSERIDQIGIPETVMLLSSIPPGSRILDIGCGNGIPITRALVRAGHTVIGLDSSSAMLERFRDNRPETPIVRGVVQACPFANRIFDAAVAWGVMFHLSRENQIQAIASVSRVLKMVAPFLFTSGDADDFEGKEGVMNGVTFRYFSFSIENYRRILGDQGFTLTDVHKDNGGNTYYVATKTFEGYG